MNCQSRERREPSDCLRSLAFHRVEAPILSGARRLTQSILSPGSVYPLSSLFSAYHTLTVFPMSLTERRPTLVIVSHHYTEKLMFSALELSPRFTPVKDGHFGFDFQEA